MFNIFETRMAIEGYLYDIIPCRLLWVFIGLQSFTGGHQTPNFQFLWDGGSSKYLISYSNIYLIIQNLFVLEKQMGNRILVLVSTIPVETTKDSHPEDLVNIVLKNKRWEKGPLRFFFTLQSGHRYPL